MTTTTSTTSATNGSAIAVTLGIGSGIDTTALVTQLAAAEKAPQEALITTRETANTAQVSSLATISSSIDSFATALKALVGGGTLFTQPTSSSSAVGVSAQAGTRIPSNLAARLQVTALAQGQTIMSARRDATQSLATGTLSLATAQGSATITLDQSNNSLSGLATAINGANLGVSASVVNDGAGSRLVVKGPAGAANAFSLSETDNGGGLADFTYAASSNSGGMTQAQAATDAAMVLDGVNVTRPSNTVTDLIPGVKLSLNATTAAAVSIGASVPTDAITGAVNDFVGAFNEVKGVLATATATAASGGTAGPFGNDPTIRAMAGQLQALTTTPLVSSGPIRTLADLGVKTNLDGTLAVDAATLNKVVATQPDAVAALFNPTQSSSSSSVQITSAMGQTPAGSYQLSNLTVGPPPTGSVNGKAMLAIGSLLVAPAGSGAAGLVIGVSADTAAATVTVEPGLSGALQAIRDGLRGGSGALTNLSNSLSTQAKQIATDRTAMETRATAYQARLSASFSTMNSRVSVLKATQSYLDQQIKVWTNSTNS